MRREYGYKWLHIPTGETGFKRISWLGPFNKLYEILDEFNRVGMGQWQYCSYDIYTDKAINHENLELTSY